MKMKQFLMGLCLFVGAASSSLMIASDADARRLGGGGNAGIKRSLPPRDKPATPPQQAQQQQQPPANNAAPAQPGNAATAGATAPAAAQAAAPRRSWLGPVAGLAAGLGLAALASHFGFGEGLANVMTVLLVALVAFVAIRFLLGRMRGTARASPNLGYAGGGLPAEPNWSERRPTSAATSLPAPALPMPGVGGGALQALPPGFDAAAFEKVAKLIFIRLQAANDAGDLQDLRAFTTPEMFAAARLDLQNRVGAAEQRTDVVQLSAAIVDAAREAERDVVSVRYSGLLREEAGGVAEPFDEVWHLVRPADGSRDWAIAGIEQSVTA